MKAQVQVALVLAAVLYLLWGLGMLVAPDRTHALLTTGPYDVATTALLGASLIGFAALFLMAAREPVRPLVRACAVALLFLGVTAGYQMFFSRSIHQAPAVATSLILDLGLAFFLMVALADGLHNGDRSESARRRMRGPRRMVARRA